MGQPSELRRDGQGDLLCPGSAPDAPKCEHRLVSISFILSAQLSEQAHARVETTLVLSGTGRMLLDSRVPLARSGVSTVWLRCIHPGGLADG